jgi:hypothetical protein
MAGFLDRHRDRVAVATAFLSHSLVTGSWASRIPGIKHSLDLTDAQLGVALFGMAAGTLIGVRERSSPPGPERGSWFERGSRSSPRPWWWRRLPAAWPR